MECKIREWKMEDAAELAATLNNKVTTKKWNTEE